MAKHAKKPLRTRGGINVYAYDTVDCLDSDETIAAYLSVSLTEDYEPDIFLGAIADALRAKGLNTIESLLKIAEEMRAPLDAPAPLSAARNTVKTPAPAKRSVRPKRGKKREIVPA